MVDIHPGIDDRHHHITAAGSHIPGFQRVDIGVIGTVCTVYILTGVMQTPQPIKMGVIRRGDIGIYNVIGLGMFHIRVFNVKLQGLIDVHAFRKLYMLKAVDGKGLPGGNIKPFLIFRGCCPAHLGSKFYQKLTGHKSRS